MWKDAVIIALLQSAMHDPQRFGKLGLVSEKTHTHLYIRVCQSPVTTNC